ncbi:MAG: SMP-30/gluconolactonase/LRE family protein [Flavobacteriales bacterium]
MFNKSLFGFIFLSVLTAKCQEFIGEIERLDSDMGLFVSKESKIEVLASGFSWAEGPVWVPKLNGVLFTDVPKNKAYLWTERQGLSVFLDPSGMTNHAPHSSNEGANGLVLDSNGALVLCQHGDRRVARLKDDWQLDPPSYETVIDHFEGKRLNSPNDLVFSKNGDLFFTDPPYGLNQQDDDILKELDFNGIFKWSKKEGIVLLNKTLSRPNGIAFSRDEKTVYIGNSDRENLIIAAFDYIDGALKNKRVFFNSKNILKKGPGSFDGLKVHSSGTIFATGPGGVLVIGPEGKHLGTIRPGKATANCAFDAAEDYLYLTSTDVLARIKLNK